MKFDGNICRRALLLLESFDDGDDGNNWTAASKHKQRL